MTAVKIFMYISQHANIATCLLPVSFVHKFIKEIFCYAHISALTVSTLVSIVLSTEDSEDMKLANLCKRRVIFCAELLDCFPIIDITM